MADVDKIMRISRNILCVIVLLLVLEWIFGFGILTAIGLTPAKGANGSSLLEFASRYKRPHPGNVKVRGGGRERFTSPQIDTWDLDHQTGNFGLHGNGYDIKKSMMPGVPNFELYGH